MHESIPKDPPNRLVPGNSVLFKSNDTSCKNEITIYRLYAFKLKTYNIPLII